MATVTYELNGKTFQFKVPKGSDQDYIDDSAQKAYDLKYGPPPGVHSPDITQNPQVNADVNQAAQSNEGFISSLGRAGKELGTGILQNPAGFMPSVQTSSPKELAHHIRDIPGEGIMSKILQGNYGGAIGEILPGAALAILASPKLRGGAIGGISSIPKTAEAVTENAGPFSRGVSRGLGGTVGYGVGKWPGMLAGRDIGESILPPAIHPIEMTKGILSGTAEGAKGKPWAPQIIGDKSAGLNINKPSPIDINNSVPIRNMPSQISQGRVLVTPPPEIHPALNQAPTITPPPTIKPQLALPPASQDFWRGPGDIPSSKVNLPESSAKQSVPAVVKSVTEELPPSKNLSVVPEESSEVKSSEVKKPIFSPEAQAKIDRLMGRKAKGDVVVTDNPQPATELAKRAKIPEEVEVNHPDKINEAPKEPKPHFTHEMMGQIAKYVSGPKERISLQEVGRYIHENDVGTYDAPTKGPENYGSNRYTKTERSLHTKNTKELINKLIKQGIEDYFEDPESYKWPTHKTKN